jgi:hypothetical protein
MCPTKTFRLQNRLWQISNMDSSGDAWLVLGAIGGPIRIVTAEEVDNILELSQLNKADKVSVTCIANLNPSISIISI